MPNFHQQLIFLMNADFIDRARQFKPDFNAHLKYKNEYLYSALNLAILGGLKNWGSIMSVSE
jgi:hypothetical protein